MSIPKNNWPGVKYLNICLEERIASNGVTRIPIHGSSWYMQFSFRLYVHTRFTNTDWTLSNIALEVGPPNELG